VHIARFYLFTTNNEEIILKVLNSIYNYNNSHSLLFFSRDVIIQGGIDWRMLRLGWYERFAYWYGWFFRCIFGFLFLSFGNQQRYLFCCVVTYFMNGCSRETVGCMNFTSVVTGDEGGAWIRAGWGLSYIRIGLKPVRGTEMHSELLVRNQ